MMAKMRLVRFIAVWSSVVAVATCPGQESAIDRADSLERQGKFKEASAILTDAMAGVKGNSLAETQGLKLEFELDRLERIRKDYPYSKETLFNDLKKSVKDLTSQEFEKWIAEGRFDSREIDGERRFMASSVSNLFFRYVELNSRRIPLRDNSKKDKNALDTCVAIKQAVLAEKKPYVLPKRFQVTMTVTAKANAAPDGEVIRAWLPIPRDYPFQMDYVFGSSSPAVMQMNPCDTSIRAAYLEQPARKNKPTEFKIEYDYTAYGVRFDWKPENVKAVNSKDAELAPYLQEAPHVVFTPEIRALSEKIAGKEKNCAVRAKLFYDWIAENIKYSYATEYSTIRNISDYCRTKGYGDCGQEALLFMTLCRLNGVPARWQSGWNMSPYGKTIHDWCEIYLAPYGWMPVDPYMGIWAMRYAKTLTSAQQREVRDFYFGGLDQYRMAANSDHNQQLNPPKQSMRSDDVDFQRGELEWGGHNIWFDQYSYKLEYKEVKVPTK
jgi:transglutaminase-like putative cysteine protease